MKSLKGMLDFITKRRLSLRKFMVILTIFVVYMNFLAYQHLKVTRSRKPRGAEFSYRSMARNSTRDRIEIHDSIKPVDTRIRKSKIAFGIPRNIDIETEITNSDVVIGAKKDNDVDKDYESAISKKASILTGSTKYLNSNNMRHISPLIDSSFQKANIVTGGESVKKEVEKKGKMRSEDKTKISGEELSGLEYTKQESNKEVRAVETGTTRSKAESDKLETDTLASKAKSFISGEKTRTSELKSGPEVSKGDAQSPTNAETSKSKAKSSALERATTPNSTEALDGKVNVYSWNDICIDRDNYNLYWNPLFPKFPIKGEFLTKLEDADWIRSKAARRLIGYINVPESGFYQIKLMSRDGLDLMVFDEKIQQDKILLHASIKKADIIEQTDKIGTYDLYTKVSREIQLKSGRKYPIDIAHTCVYFGRIEVHIKKRSDETFKIIDSSYLSPYHATSDASEEMPDAFFSDNASELREKFNQDRRLSFGGRYSLNSKTCSTGLKACEYKPSYLFTEDKIQEYDGQNHVKVDLIYPDDHTTFEDKDTYERLLNKSTAERIANEVFDAISRENPRKYTLQHIAHVEENKEESGGKRYFVELDLESEGKAFRFSDYFYKPRLNKSLCLPEGHNGWRHDVMVYMVCAVKDQRPWVQYLIKSLEDLVQRTGDEKLHLIVVDFYSTDVDVEKLLKKSKLSFSFLQMPGNFSKVRALNKAVEMIPGDDGIVFVMDLQLQIPDHIFDQSRKHTIEGKMTYCPILMRLYCGQHPEYTSTSMSLWMGFGYGMMSLYKRDWKRIGGMNEEKFKYRWGGEDWEFVDRVILGKLELVHQRLPGFYHIYHSTRGTWDGTKLIR